MCTRLCARGGGAIGSDRQHNAEELNEVNIVRVRLSACGVRSVFMDLPLDFKAALARLDADIEAAEARLSDLQLKRTGAVAFLDYLRFGESADLDSKTASSEATSQSPATASASSVGPTELVLAAVRRIGDREFNIDQLHAEIEDHGGIVEREQARNSVHYLVRKGDLRNARRGVYVRPTNTETPASPGASVADQPTEGWSRKEGVPDGTGTLRDHDLHPDVRDDDRAHDLRAAIVAAPE